VREFFASQIFVFFFLAVQLAEKLPKRNTQRIDSSLRLPSSPFWARDYRWNHTKRWRLQAQRNWWAISFHYLWYRFSCTNQLCCRFHAFYIYLYFCLRAERESRDNKELQFVVIRAFGWWTITKLWTLSRKLVNRWPQRSLFLIDFYFCFFFKVKVAGFHLIPFFKTVIIYFICMPFGFWDSQVLSTILKCAPIVCLMGFIVLRNFRLTKEFRFHQFILLGLVFSCAGDAFLDYRSGELFVFGMIAFAFAQISYVSAFGWQPLRLLIGILFYVFGAAGELMMQKWLPLIAVPFAVVSLMFKNLEDILIVGVPIYCLLLLTMGWRASARVKSMNHLTHVLCAVGGLSFVISDLLIAINLFYTPIAHGHVYVMITYYLAQVCITLSVLDHQPKVGKAQKSN